MMGGSVSHHLSHLLDQLQALVDVGVQLRRRGLGVQAMNGPDGLAVSELLCVEAGDGEHTQAAVLQLDGALPEELVLICGLEANRAEAEVTHSVVGAELPVEDVVELLEEAGFQDTGSSNEAVPEVVEVVVGESVRGEAAGPSVLGVVGKEGG